MFSGIKKNCLMLVLAVSSLAHAAGQPLSASPNNPQPSIQKKPSVEASEKAATGSTPALASKRATEETCLKLYQKFIPSLQELWKKRANELRPENTDGYALIEDMTADHCKNDDSRSDLLNLLSKILNNHSGRVGVILPVGSYPYLRHAITAFEARIRQENLDPKKVMVIIDNLAKPEKTLQALASMVFEHKVSAIIGGTEPSDANTLRLWAPKLMLPTFLMSEPTGTPKIPFVYYAYPSQKVLAEAAVQANLRFAHKRISILSPSDQHSSRFVSAYVEAAKTAGINVIHQVTYDSRRFDSMEAAARKIFRLDPAERREDLKKLYETAKKHSDDTGEAFNPKMIALQPDIQQDAVLIPDNFKIVRHLAKLFSYLGVRRMPLFGHYEWRSRGLIAPWDNFLAGAYFVDLQGSYQNLPPPIRLAPSDSTNLLPPDKVEQADFSLLAWRAMEVPLAIAQKKNDMRRKLETFIPRANSSNNEAAVGPSSSVSYNADNAINWAPSLFTVTGKTTSSGAINLIAP